MNREISFKKLFVSGEYKNIKPSNILYTTFGFAKLVLVF